VKNILLSILIILIFIPQSEAIDVATEHTQIMNNIELLIQNYHELETLYNQTMMIKYQIEQLKSIASYKDSWGDVDSIKRSVFDLVNRGRSLSDQTQDLFLRMKKEADVIKNNGTMSDQVRSTGKGTMEIADNSLNRVKDQRNSYQQEMDAVNKLMDKSNEAVGQTQAIQTLNQTVAQMIPQMQMMRELLSEQITLQTAIIAKENQKEQELADQRDQFFTTADNAKSSFKFKD
jgi:P-type conjugative transfer protein TrbJ